MQLKFITFAPQSQALRLTTHFYCFMSLKENIDMQRLPSHIAIIMDGNGRWAKEKGEDRLYGHLHGVESVLSMFLFDSAGP